MLRVPFEVRPTRIWSRIDFGRYDREHKKTEFHSRAAGPRNQRLCLVPHTCRFPGQQSLGIKLAVKWSSLHLVPTLPFREGGRPVRQAKVSRRVTAFCGLVPLSRFRCGKRKAPTPLPMCRGQGGALCFPPMPLGTARAREVTTPPADAHNVTQSRKICGSRRFALFRMAAL